jgi:mRNA interferase HigB
MVVISKTILKDFGKKHADAVDPLNEWWEKVRRADWASVQEVKRTFNSVDFVGNERFVFDIKGNKYRLVAMIFFDIMTIYVRFVGTHDRYDKINCATI